MTPEYLQEEMAADSCLVKRFALANNNTRETSNHSVVALKFGGTSLLGAERMLHAAGLVRAAAQDSDVIVVVSAMKGVTDRLLSISRALAEGKLSHARNEAESVIHLHLDVLQDLQLEEEKQDRVRFGLQLLGRDLLHEAPSQGRVVVSAELADRLASFGERLSARLFAAALEKSGVPAIPVSSSDFVLTCDTFRDAKPQLEETKHRGRGILLPLLEDGLVPVVTGFIGATPDGRITTLGRNSSDFSGAIIAHVVDAEELVIWTDVDGIYTSNPHASVEAKLLHDLSYDEAHALAASGAKVLHPHVLPLAAETEMTIWIRNTFKPHVRGTRIGLPQNPNDRAQCGGAA
jgi:bifunctional aspartokinase / homoserine dehydrogenase 1